jgi:hypothetical protein
MNLPTIYRYHVATNAPPPPVESWEEFGPTVMQPRYIAESVAEELHPSAPAPESIIVHVYSDRHGGITVWRVRSVVEVNWHASEVDP